MVVSRLADQKRWLARGLRGRAHGYAVWRLAHCPKSQLVGVRYSYRSAKARLYVFVGDSTIVTGGVVVTEVHGRGIGRPEPDFQFACRSRCAGDLQCRGMLLPKAFDPDGYASRHIAQERVTGGPLAIHDMHPRAGRIGTLVN